MKKAVRESPFKRKAESVIPLSKMPVNGSDLALKKKVRNLQNSLAKVMALRPVMWYWKTDAQEDDPQYGFIAQEVEKQLPDLVSNAAWKDGTIKKHLSTGDLMPYLVDAIKEQQTQIEELKQAIRKLKTTR